MRAPTAVVAGKSNFQLSPFPIFFVSAPHDPTTGQGGKGIGGSLPSFPKGRHHEFRGKRMSAEDSPMSLSSTRSYLQNGLSPWRIPSALSIPRPTDVFSGHLTLILRGGEGGGGRSLINNSYPGPFLDVGKTVEEEGEAALFPSLLFSRRTRKVAHILCRGTY